LYAIDCPSQKVTRKKISFLHNDGFGDLIVLAQDGTPQEVNDKPRGAVGKTAGPKSR